MYTIYLAMLYADQPDTSEPVEEDEEVDVVENIAITSSGVGSFASVESVP